MAVGLVDMLIEWCEKQLYQEGAGRAYTVRLVEGLGNQQACLLMFQKASEPRQHDPNLHGPLLHLVDASGSPLAHLCHEQTQSWIAC